MRRMSFRTNSVPRDAPCSNMRRDLATQAQQIQPTDRPARHRLDARLAQRLLLLGQSPPAFGEKIMTTIVADPYPWPFDGQLTAANTALIVIDMQTDFCGVGRLRRQDGLRPVADARAHRADPQVAGGRCESGASTSCTPAKVTAPISPICPPTSAGDRSESAPASAMPGPCGRILVRGEPGWEIIPELAPLPGEVVIDKPGKGSFYATDLELSCTRAASATRCSPASPPTSACTRPCATRTIAASNVCCSPTARGATDHGNHLAALKMVTMQGGVFGATADSAALLAGLPALAA